MSLLQGGVILTLTNNIHSRQQDNRHGNGLQHNNAAAQLPDVSLLQSLKNMWLPD